MNEQDHQAPTKPPRRARPWRLMAWMVGLSVTAIALLWVFANFSLPVRDGQPLVPVSPETTWFTEPLDQNGDVDYRKLFFDRLPKPIPADENAFVYYLRALGPRWYTGRETALKLGLSEQDLEIEYVMPNDWVCNHYDIKNGNHLYAREQITQATMSPWRPEILPIVELYYQEHRERIDLILKGTQCPQFRLPPEWFPRYRSTYRSIIDDANQFLFLEAMRFSGLSDIDSALDRLEASLRISAQFDSIPTLYGYMIRAMVTQSIHQRIATVVCVEGCEEQHLNRALRLINEYRVPARWEERIENDVLNSFHDLQFLGRHGLPAWDTDGTHGVRILGFEVINWEAVFRRHVSISKEALSLGPSAVTRDLGRIDESTARNTDYIFLRRKKTREQSELGYYIIEGGFRQQNASHRLTTLTCQLHLHRIAHGDFPDSIEALEPTVWMDQNEEDLGQVLYLKDGDEVILGIYGNSYQLTDKKIKTEIEDEKLRSGSRFPVQNQMADDYLYVANLTPYDCRQIKEMWPVDVEEMKAARRD